MISATPNVSPISTPSTTAHDRRACPWCRKHVDVADAAFVSTLAHPECAPKIRAREQPVDLVESAIAFGLVVAFGWFAILALVGPFSRWLVGAGG
jgi:hypothetical protein